MIFLKKFYAHIASKINDFIDGCGGIVGFSNLISIILTGIIVVIFASIGFAATQNGVKFINQSLPQQNQDLYNASVADATNPCWHQWLEPPTLSLRRSYTNPQNQKLLDLAKSYASQSVYYQTLLKTNLNLINIPDKQINDLLLQEQDLSLNLDNTLWDFKQVCDQSVEKNYDTTPYNLENQIKTNASTNASIHLEFVHRFVDNAHPHYISYLMIFLICVFFFSYYFPGPFIIISLIAHFVFFS